MNKELKRGCVVFMKASSGLIGYGNAQCVSDVHGAELGTISLYGHNQHYKTYDIDKIVEYPTPQTENEQIKGFVRMALDELGVPNKDYPAPVANAVGFLNEALKDK